MILLVDNYDSFTFNLMQYLSRFDEVHVLRNDDERLYDVAKKADGIVLSPGPGWPSDAGQMEELIKDFAGQKPILGICLGHQAIAESFEASLTLLSRSCTASKARWRLKSYLLSFRMSQKKRLSCVIIPLSSRNYQQGLK